MSIARGFSLQVPPPVTPRQDPPMPPTPSSTYERLRDYIATRMRMSHVYQPSAIADADPVTPGRSLVIPRRHGADGLA